MFLCRLHAGGWHGPDCLVQIDFGPCCPQHFAGARGCQNDKFQRQRRHCLPLPQLRHERRDCLIGHGFVMAARKPGTGRQYLRDMAAPARRVFTLPVSARLGGIEHGFNPPPDTAGSFGLVLPDRLKDFQHMRRANIGNWQFAHDGIDVAGQRVAPLLPVLVIAPACLIRADIRLCHGLEGDSGYLCRLSRRKGLSGSPVALRKRINARLSP